MTEQLAITYLMRHVYSGHHCERFLTILGSSNSGELTNTARRKIINKEYTVDTFFKEKSVEWEAVKASIQGNRILEECFQRNEKFKRYIDTFTQPFHTIEACIEIGEELRV